MDKKIPIKLLRGLLIKQKGQCAISGLPLTTKNMTGDHIYPLVLQKQEGNPEYDNRVNLWLVHKAFNRMKSTFTYDELIDNCKSILANEKKARKLMNDINSGSVEECERSSFEDLIEKNYDIKTDTLEFK